MKNKKRGGVVFHAGSLILVIFLSAAAGFVIGLLLPGFLNTREDAQPGEPMISAPQVSDAHSDELLESPDEEIETPSGVPQEEPSAIPPKISPETRPEIVPQEEPRDYRKAADYVASMSLREKLCQMLIVTPDAITGVSGTKYAGPVTKEALEKYPVGGLIHFSQNISDGEQITRFNSNVQSYSKTPMFIATDEEGGRVGRLKTTLGAHSLNAMLSYEDRGEEAAFENAKVLSGVLEKYGFNTDFAPVADVWSRPENTVIGDRAYSTDFDNAARLVAAAVRGFNESGIICSLKHFPGHGDTREDSHNGAAYVMKTLGELRENEFKPFEAGIYAGADMVMAGHLIVPEADKLPATLSKTLLTDILRDELGFEGVIITDSLAMGAVSSNYSTEFVAVTAVKAGVDILLMPNGIERTISALTEAVESGEIPQSHIDESVTRIIALKAVRGIIEL